MLAFCEALKAVYGPLHQIQATLCSLDGSTILTNKEAILQRWSEHFEGLFSHQCTVQESSLTMIPQVDMKLALDDPPTHEEIKKTTMQLQLKVGKSSGIDGIQLLGKRDSTAGPQGCSHCLSVQKQGRKSDCSNYRGITLLSIAGKISARFSLNGLIPTTAQRNTAESQCGSRSNRGTADMIFMLRHIQENCRKQSICSFRRPDQGL